MAALPAPARRALRRRVPARPVERTASLAPAALPAVDIAADDPLLAYATAHAGVITVDQPPLASPALAALRDAGVALIVPLVTHGELIGLLNLGPRLSERPYSGDDKRLLEELATHAAPAIRVAQLVTEQQAEAAERERMHQELRIAQLIQQQFLPRQLPDLAGWHIAADYQPAREIGGDFYDFIALPDRKVGLVAGDVAGKGVPAALVMATTHSLLRAEAPRHNLPYVTGPDGTRELRARELPLGLMRSMTYESVTASSQRGERMLLHSFTVSSEPGNERPVMTRVTEAVAPLGLPSAPRRRLETAVGEAATNAIEHGNHNRPELPVEVQVLTDDRTLRVLVTDVGGDPHLPTGLEAAPDLATKLAGLDSPRGWGLFLITNMVDRVTSTSDGRRHTLELELTLDPDRHSDAHDRVGRVASHRRRRGDSRPARRCHRRRQAGVGRRLRARGCRRL